MGERPFHRERPRCDSLPIFAASVEAWVQQRHAQLDVHWVAMLGVISISWSLLYFMKILPRITRIRGTDFDLCTPAPYQTQTDMSYPAQLIHWAHFSPASSCGSGQWFDCWFGVWNNFAAVLFIGVFSSLFDVQGYCDDTLNREGFVFKPLGRSVQYLHHSFCV